MRVLYIGDRGAGGIANHVNCLAGCLPDGVERYSINVGGDEEFAGKSGHDLREWFQIRRVMKTFKPDVVHFHTCCILMALYMRLISLKVRKFESLKVNSQTLKPSNFRTFKLLCSWHTPTRGKMSWKLRIFFWLLGKDCTFLPVSTPTWEGLKRWLPYARGEVFFNPIRIGGGLEVLKFGGLDGSLSKHLNIQTSKHLFTVGMVGRNADQKDWPTFCAVAQLIKMDAPNSDLCDFIGVGAAEEEAKGFGDGAKFVEWKGLQSNGREWIGKMDLFVMTSKHEQLPTTALECFVMGTPICGFIPKGGMSDILSFSKGPVRDAFIAERNCDKLSEIVMDLLAHPEKRQALIEDGWQIVQHFDAEKNVKGQLMRVYERV